MLEKIESEHKSEIKEIDMEIFKLDDKIFNEPLIFSKKISQKETIKSHPQIPDINAFINEISLLYYISFTTGRNGWQKTLIA